MSDRGGKHGERRRKLKKNLYNLLKNEPNGIPKAYLWNTYHSETKEPVAAHYYGLSKMHNILDRFDDMVTQVIHEGKEKIQLLHGYVPSDDSDDDDDDDDDDVQIPQVSSSKVTKAETTTQNPRGNQGSLNANQPSDNVDTGICPTPVQVTFGIPSYLFPRQLTQQQFIPLQFGTIPPQSLSGLPNQQHQQLLQQQQQQQILQQQKLSSHQIFVREQQNIQQHKTSQQQTRQKQEVLTLSDSESDSCSESDFPTLQQSLQMGTQGHNQNVSSRDSNIKKLKQNLTVLLKENSKGIKKSEIWDRYRKRFNSNPKKSDYGVPRLSDILNLFTDVLETFTDKLDIEYVRLKSMQRPQNTVGQGITWGKGAVINQNLGVRNSPTLSTSSLDSPTGFSLGHGTNPSRSIMSNTQMPITIDLTGATSSCNNPRRDQSLGHLTTDQDNSGFISLTTANTSGSIRALGAASSNPPPRRGSVIDLTGSSSQHINVEKFEDREITVTPVRLPRGQVQPNRDQLEAIAQECIEILADANQHVNSDRVEKLLLQKFRVNNLSHLGVRYINMLNCVNELNRSVARVNAYIQAFVRVRSICTLNELRDCLLEFAPDKGDFASLKIGPLQRLPMVYQMFKFPPDVAEIPAITTIDILEHLRNYMNRYQKWTEKLVLEDFMNFLVEEYSVEDAYILGVRIRSLPLAAQVLKKSQRDAGMTTRSVTESMKEGVRKEIEAVFQKFKFSVMQTGSDGSNEVRRHYLQISPEMAIAEIFEKFKLLMTSLERPTSRLERRKYLKLEESIHSFIDSVRQDNFVIRLFHLAICISNTELEEAAMELLTPSQGPSSPTQDQNKQPPAKEQVVNDLKKYLTSCMNRGAISLKHFDQIEERLLTDFDFPHFQAMGFGRFLEFLLREAKQMLEECGGTVLGAGAGHQDGDGGFIPKRTEVLEFIDQCGKMEPSQVESAICQQFCVKDVKNLGHGNISRLLSSASDPGKHKSSQHLVVYEACLMDTASSKCQTKGQIGILGHQTREAALACLHKCPLLENIGSWCQWTLVFEPELGKLKDFVQKYGGIHTSNIEGGKKIMTTDISALEVRHGQYLKLVTQTSPEKFECALSKSDVTGVCGHLMSMVVSNKGVENTPLALLANYVKEALFKLHADTSCHDTPGAPPSDESRTDKAVNFVMECLNKLPLRSCAVVASQIFLDPLGQVVGSTKSKSLLMKACRTITQENCLQELGCLLGISEWTHQLQAKCMPPLSTLEDIPVEEAEEFFNDNTVEMEESDDESESESSSDSSFLSDVEDDDQEVQMKSQDVKDLIVLDEVYGSSEESMDVEKETSKSDEEVDKDKETEQKESGEVEASPTEEEECNEDGTPLTAEQKQERECRIIVEQIRRDEFGIGVELNEDGQRLMAVQQERLGRSLDRLSKDLYSKDTHFVLELVQNADDNSYPDELFLEDNKECPTVKFMMTSDGIVVLNNEIGFEEKNIRALCDVGRSTKGKHKAGYIGQKGIGFKSVFRVTDGPEVHSNGYHIKFDVNSGPTGYILPHWCEDVEAEEEWKTKIALPLKDEMKAHFRSLAARFNDIHPSLLLFLNRLHQIIIENQVENSTQAMRRKNQGNNIVEIQHSDGTDKWLVVKKMLDASKISLQAKSGVEVESTEIALAFPLKPQGQKNMSVHLPPKQPVFAYLPLRSYGFRFIIQGDFDVPSSREDVDRDSPWNQWIRNEIHVLFIDALEAFKNLPDYNVVEAVTTFLQFVPAEDEILDFFRPVAAQILQKLRAKACVPTQPNNKGTYTWKIPSQTVTVKDPLVHEVVTPELLKENLNLYYLRRDVASVLNPALSQCLGIECLTTEHLLLLGKSLFLKWEKDEVADLEERIIMAAKWLACMYRSLDDFQDNQEVYDKLKAMKVIFLTSPQPVAIADKAVFFPLTEEFSKLSYRDPMRVLQVDLDTMHPLMVNTHDTEVNSQVYKLLLKMGVCQLSPRDVISQHILPVLMSDGWQEKNRDILTSYVVYIKEQLERDSSLLTFDKLANIIRLQTNHGIKNPKETPIHFTPMYNNKQNLQENFPGYDWTLLDSVYIKENSDTQLDRQRWRQFFSKLGVTDSIAIRQQKVAVSAETINSLPWAPLAKIWGELQEGTYIDDWESKELFELISQNKSSATYQEQMKLLCELLDQDWNKTYSSYTTTQLCGKDGQRIRECDTSFSIHLRTLSWLPAVQTTVWFEKDENIVFEEKIIMMPPHCLYRRFPGIEQVFAHTVLYVNVYLQSVSEFSKFLKLKDSIEIDEVKKSLIEWGKRTKQNEATVFCTSLNHIKTVYEFLSDNLPPKDSQDLIRNNPVVFVPIGSSGIKYNSFKGSHAPPPHVTPGKMLNRQEVWWEDKTGLFMKYKKMLDEYHADISKKSTISSIYMHKLLHFFQSGLIAMEPEMAEYGELLVLIGQLLSPTDPLVVSDVLKLYVLFWERSFVLDSDPEKPTKVQIIQTKKEALMRKLKGQKILITKNKEFVSIEEKPLIANNKELEKMYKQKKGVHFLQLEEIRHTAQGRNYRGRETRPISSEDLDPFLKMCGIQKLSDLISITPITESFQPCPELQYYVHRIVPSIQILLYNKFSSVYQDLTRINFATTLKDLQFIKVSQLQVRYSLGDWGPDFDILKDEKCLIEEKNVYFHKDHMDSYMDINREIAKFFSQNDIRCANELKLFLMEYTQSDGNVDELLERHDCDESLPLEEVVWQVEPPVQPVHQQPQVIEEPFDDVPVITATEKAADGQSQDEDQSDSKLKSWPPMSDEAGRARKKKTLEGSTSQDSQQKESKIWPPPKAPDYLKSVKELPSQFKMAKEAPSSGDVSERGEKLDDKPKAERSGTTDHPQDENTQVVYRRQESGDSMYHHEGVKRKISESEQASGITKRPNSSEGSLEKTVDYTSTENQRSDIQTSGGVQRSDIGTSEASSSSTSQHDGKQGDIHRKQGDGYVNNGENQMSGERKDGESPHDTDRSNYVYEDRGGYSTKRRHITGDSNSPTPPSPKKSAIHMDDPFWSEFASEYTFEELGIGASLKLPPANITLDKGSEKPEIGRWGELLVFQYLLQQKDLHHDIINVRWCNEMEEEGLPYDMEVIIDTGSGTHSLYIEVKSTVSDTKDLFEISSQQVQFACEQKDRFSIYRVFNAGDSEKVRLVRIDNLSIRLDQKQVKLCMLI